jgi:hypothetical protein
MREAVMRMASDGVPKREIADYLCTSTGVVTKYRNAALRKSIQRERDRLRWKRVVAKHHAMQPKRPKLLPGFSLMIGDIIPPDDPAEDRQDLPPDWMEAVRGPDSSGLRALPPPSFSDGEEDDDTVPPSSSSSPHGSSPHSSSGEVLDSPDALIMRQECLRLRKAMIPYDIMAQALHITTKEAKQYTSEALIELQESEELNTDLHRQLMIAQIDQMIAAIHAPSTGSHLDGTPVPVMLEAIDRMLKLMKQKAELLGLNTPVAVDIRIRLQSLAAEGGYDIVELEDIAKEVLQAHKVKLPDFN